jgi:hypothetical protein
MAFPNTSVTDLVISTLAKRSKTISDNIIGNNAGFDKIKKKGNAKNIDGGRTIYEPFIFASNSNAGWYSGYDILLTDAADVLGGAEFPWKQASCQVVISGLEMLKNAGDSQYLDLMDARMTAAESTMDNLMTTGFFSDGTGSGGKQLDGVKAAISATPTTGTYGGVNRATATNTFWRNYFLDTAAAPSASTILQKINTAMANLTFGKDRPDLAICDDDVWAAFQAAMQTNQRFTDPGTADAGFLSIKHMGMDVVLDGTCTDITMYLLNTKYLSLKSHKDRNMVPLGKNRSPYNQDAEVAILAWAGNMTCSQARTQGRIQFDA